MSRQIVTKGGNIGKTVAISCRARKKCKGKQALIQMKIVENGQVTTRYKCADCRDAFNITTGGAFHV